MHILLLLAKIKRDCNYHNHVRKEILIFEAYATVLNIDLDGSRKSYTKYRYARKVLFTHTMCALLLLIFFPPLLVSVA